MAQLSSRITGLNSGGSDGWDVFYRARDMIARGGDIIELTIGEHDIGTAPSILNAMHASALGGHTGYAGVPGTQGLRAEIAKRVETRTGVPTRPENIIVTAGGQAALFAAHLAALDPGDAALYVDPFYATYPGTIRGASGMPHVVHTHAKDAFLPNGDTLSDIARKTKARSLLINSPNNPTGTVYPRRTLEVIADICNAQDMWLISDEVYDTQIWEGTHVSPRALPGMAERTLVIGSMSKSHAMTGSRIGWIVAPADAIAALTSMANGTTYGVPGYIQDGALFALQQGAGLEAEIAEPFRRRRILAREVLSQFPKLHAIPSQGAMYIMLDIRATGLGGDDFAMQLLQEHGVAVMPGESFGAAAAGHVRIALTTSDDKLVAALKTLCEFAQTLMD